MGFFSDVVGGVSDFVGGVGDVLEGIGGAVGIGGQATTPVVPGYSPSEASFLSSPQYQAQIQAMEQDLLKPQGQSLAELMARRQGAEIARQSASLMASQRGMNPAAAAKLASEQGVAARTEMAGRAAEIRAQEDMANRRFQQSQRQDILSALEADRQAKIAKEQIASGAASNTQALQFKAEEGKKDRLGSFLGGLGSAAVSGGMSSMFGGSGGSGGSGGAGSFMSSLALL